MGGRPEIEGVIKNYIVDDGIYCDHSIVYKHEQVRFRISKQNYTVMLRFCLDTDEEILLLNEVTVVMCEHGAIKNTITYTRDNVLEQEHFFKCTYIYDANKLTTVERTMSVRDFSEEWMTESPATYSFTYEDNGKLSVVSSYVDGTGKNRNRKVFAGKLPTIYFSPV